MAEKFFFVKKMFGTKNVLQKKVFLLKKCLAKIKLAKKIFKKHNKVNLIYSANTISHIKNLDEVFKAINIVLDNDGIFIIEDPSLLECLKKNTYDQFYNEHIYVFSYTSLSNVLKKHNLEIFRIENYILSIIHYRSNSA